jgi:hypothetical protein
VHTRRSRAGIASGGGRTCTLTCMPCATARQSRHRHRHRRWRRRWRGFVLAGVGKSVEGGQRRRRGGAEATPEGVGGSCHGLPRQIRAWVRWVMGRAVDQTNVELGRQTTAQRYQLTLHGAESCSAAYMCLCWCWCLCSWAMLIAPSPPSDTSHA